MGQLYGGAPKGGSGGEGVQMAGQVRRDGPGQVAAVTRRASSFVGQGGAASRLPHTRAPGSKGENGDSGHPGLPARYCSARPSLQCHDRLDVVWAGGRGGQGDEDLSLWWSRHTWSLANLSPPWTSGGGDPCGPEWVRQEMAPEHRVRKAEMVMVASQ